MKFKLLSQTTLYSSLVVSLTILGGCAHSISNSSRNDVSEEEFLNSSDGKSYPDWAFKEPRFIRDGVMYVSGGIDLNGDQNPNAGLEAAALKARVNLASEIKLRLEQQVQYATEGFTADSQSLQNIISQSARLDGLYGTSVSQRWYGRYRVNNGSGPQAVYRCFTLAAIPVNQIRSQMAKAMQSETKLSKSFQQKIDQQWDHFFGEEQTKAGTENKSVVELKPSINAKMSETIKKDAVISTENTNTQESNSEQTSGVKTNDKHASIIHSTDLEQ